MRQEELEAMTETHECSVCGAPLSLIWNADKNDYALVCGENRSHEGYKPHEGTFTAVARGKDDKLLGKGGQSDMEKQLSKAKHPLSMLPKKDIATNTDISQAMIESLVKWGESLGLKPYLGHVCLYHGKPYVTIDGFYYKLSQKEVDLYVGTRPLTADERLNYRVPDGAHAWISEAWLGITKLPTTGIGIVTKDEIEGKSKKDPEQFSAPVVHAHPQRMAEKRAEWQLLRKLVPMEEKEGISDAQQM